VVISGKSEDTIYDCIDKIRQDEDKFLDELADRVRYDDPRKTHKEPEKKEEQGVQISGAPWQMLEEQFPAIGASVQQPGGAQNPVPQQAASAGVWGSKRW